MKLHAYIYYDEDAQGLMWSVHHDDPKRDPEQPKRRTYKYPGWAECSLRKWAADNGHTLTAVHHEYGE